jgi:hypothetical protein
VLFRSGGNGTDGGGSGGQMDCRTTYGAFVSSGTFMTAGGSATIAANNGNGGYGGQIYIYAYGEVRMTGSLNTAGGNGVGTGDGGSGGYLYVYGDYDYDYGYGEYTTFGMYIGCNINTNGGNGEYGGSAGWTYFYRYDEGYCRPGKEPVYLVGYATIDLSGGDGGIDGGDASTSSNRIRAYYDYDETNTNYAGNLFVASNIIARGGKGGTGYGGDGAYVDLETENSAYTTQGSDYGLYNSGTIDTSGGDGVYGGGAGGVYLYGRYNTVNSGALLANGGSGTTGYGGGGDGIYIDGSLNVVNTGALSSNGGSSVDDYGGDGYGIYIYGLNVTAGGSYSANGGNGGTGAGDTGGDGAYITINSQESSTVWSGAFSNVGGTGTIAGTDGEFWLDGVLVAGP